MKNLDLVAGLQSRYDKERTPGRDIVLSLCRFPLPIRTGTSLPEVGPFGAARVVAVISDRGAWTAHFWERFLMDDNLFQTQVLNFLAHGNGAEGYYGLSNLIYAGGPVRHIARSRLSFSK